MPPKAMRLAVLGANGNSEKEVVTQALEHGHTVIAVVRSPEKLVIEHARLKIVKCDDVFRRENLDPHFVGCDAVVSCLGRPIPSLRMPWAKETFLLNSMRSIVPAMRLAKVSRLVAMSWYLDTKAADIPAKIKWYYIPFLFGHIIDDHYEMEKYVERECPDINYTLIRLPFLVDEPEVSMRTVSVVDDGAMCVPELMQISRADTARFLLSCLATDKWDKKCPAVATH